MDRWRWWVRDAVVAVLVGGVAIGFLEKAALDNLSRTMYYATYIAAGVAAWWFVRRTETPMWAGIPIAVAAGMIGIRVGMWLISGTDPLAALSMEMVAQANAAAAGSKLAAFLSDWGPVVLAGLGGGWVAASGGGLSGGGGGGGWAGRRRTPWRRLDQEQDRGGAMPGWLWRRVAEDREDDEGDQ